jgi:microcystin-dependent protein
MATPFLGEIKVISWNFPPKGWAFCNGQLLPINQNQALFSILGTTYGGDGRVNFALPDLRGRVPVHTGNPIALGQSGGEEIHTLTTGELPAHTHQVKAVTDQATLVSPAGNLWARGAPAAYSSSPNGTMNPAAVTNVGGSQPHSNLQPYLTLNFIIALQGLFPSQN